MDLNDYLEKYGREPADEFGGPESARRVIDYGPPVVLADSARKQDRSEHEKQLGEQLGRVAREL